nr:MAG TPA: hypothetical protein [Caudoviricetes sp.]
MLTGALWKVNQKLAEFFSAVLRFQNFFGF